MNTKKQILLASCLGATLSLSAQDKEPTKEFRALITFPKVNPEKSINAFVFMNKDKFDFNVTG